MYLILGLYLKGICKYNQIHIKILPTKGDINWLRSLIRSRQAPLRKCVYSEGGQTLASMNEWEASEAYL